MITHSEKITALAVSLIAVQGEIGGVVKDSKNPHFKSNYASLEAVIHAAKPSLLKNGIAFTQAPGVLIDGAIEITTMLLHSSGEWLSSTMHIPLQKREPQGVGSAITYGCRYALMATLGLPPVDDDAEHATMHGPSMTQLLTAAEAKIDAAAKKGLVHLEATWTNMDPDLKPALKLKVTNLVDELKRKQAA